MFARLRVEAHVGDNTVILCYIHLDGLERASLIVIQWELFVISWLAIAQTVGMPTVAKDPSLAVLVPAVGPVAIAVVPAAKLAAPVQSPCFVELAISAPCLLAKKRDIILIRTLYSASVMSNALDVLTLGRRFWSSPH